MLLQESLLNMRKEWQVNNAHVCVCVCDVSVLTCIIIKDGEHT